MKEYATPSGKFRVDPGWTDEVQLAARIGFALVRVTPADREALRPLLKSARPGAPVPPLWVVTHFLAHAIKWAPSVRHFLGQVLDPSGAVRAATGAELVLALRATVRWSANRAEEDAWKDMFARDCPKDRMGRNTGLQHTAQRLGLVAPARKDAGGSFALRPGEWFTAPGDGAAAEALFEEGFRLAGAGALVWPEDSAIYVHFTDELLRWASVVRELVVETGAGPKAHLGADGAGPKAYRTRAWCLCVAGCAIQARPSVLGGLTLGDLARFAPDVKGHLRALQDMSFATAAQRFSVEPWWLGAWACLLGTVTGARREALRRARPAALLHPVEVHEALLAARRAEGDEFPYAPPGVKQLADAAAEDAE